MVTQKDLSLLAGHLFWINPNEQVLWVGQPNKSAYVANEFWELSRGLLFIGGAIGFIMLIGSILKKEILWFETGFFFSIVLVMGVYSVVKRLIERRATVYVLTDSRVLIFKRFTQSDVIFLEISGLVSQELQRTFIDRNYSTGTLAFHSGIIDDTDDKPKKVYDSFHSIDKPNEILNLVAEVQRCLSQHNLDSD
ncbi:MAG: hypothetical protein EOP52_07085 [Sphingobacteriales bacterium]|nr:MAG: hypothetical protein EOP52_07085 [Sphingobacteriales bacterium]